MNTTELIKAELNQAQEVLAAFRSDEPLLLQIEKGAQLLVSAMKSGNKVISCGNGGSHCDAMHLAEELMGRFRDDRRPYPAVSISDPAYISCAANDFGYDHVFSRYVEGIGKPGDVLVTISTSGNSINVIEAADVARAQGLSVLALTGNDGGELGGKADIEIRVPHHGYADRIQEMHIKIIHILILLIEKMMP